jgi:8-oxo-dGTP pyrophosphatase MutT (NUDIX family)
VNIDEFLHHDKWGTGVLLQWNKDFLFVLAKERYWKKDGEFWEISYTNTGGHVEINEGIIEATKREVLEELGCECTLITSTQTVVCELEDPKPQIYNFEEKISPFLIYNSRRMQLSVCVYLGILESSPFPHMEVPGIVLLPRKLIQGGKLSSLLSSGAQIIHQNDRKIPTNSYLIPFGSTELLVNFWNDFMLLDSFRHFIGGI